MQGKLIFKPQGSSTLEILIASAVLSLTLTAATSVVFGNEVAAGELPAQSTALALAEEQLEGARARALSNFDTLIATSSTRTIRVQSFTLDLSLGSIDAFTTQASSTVRWSEHGRTHTYTLTTQFGNPHAVFGGDTCAPSLPGGWRHPSFSTPYPIDTLLGDASGNVPTSLDAYDGTLAVTTDNTAAHTDDLYLFNLSDPRHPILAGSIDANGVKAGLNAARATRNQSARLLYVANANDPNFTACSESPSCAQALVLDSTNPSAPVLSATIKLSAGAPPYVTGNLSGRDGQAVGKSLAYQDGYLYLGLSTTAAGPGFHIIDVHDPLHPLWVGSWPEAHPGLGSSGAPINAIAVRGDIAYLAHPTGLAGATSEQLTVLNIRDKTHPTRIGSFFWPGGISGNGKSLAWHGGTLLLGRTGSNISGQPDSLPELFTFDVADQEHPALKGAVALPTAQSVQGIISRDEHAFLALNTLFEVWDFSGSAPSLIASADLSTVVGPSAKSFALDCEGEYLYLGSYRPSDEKSAITVIHAS